MKTVKEILQEYLDAISAGDLERALALFAPDGVLEFPLFGAVGVPTRMVGPDAIRNTFKPFLAGVEDFHFKNVKMYAMADPNQISGEYEVDAYVKATKRRYRQLYGGRMVVENGKIKLLREFANSVEVARALFPNGVKDLVQTD